MMENFRKIVGIFVTKPKFHALALMPDASPLIGWLAEIVIPMLQAGALRSGVPKPNRIEFLRALRGLLELSTSLHESNKELFPVPPFSIDLPGILPSATNPTLDQVHRTAALEVVDAYGRGKHTEVTRALAQNAQDVLALEPMWANGAIKDPKCVEVVRKEWKEVLRKYSCWTELPRQQGLHCRRLIH
jgi:hypothetical protein